MKKLLNLFGLAMLFVAAILQSCEKTPTKTTIEPGNLTDCATCEFHYQESKQLEGYRIEDGDARVFSYKDYWASADGESVGPNYTGLFFEVPMGKTPFTLGKRDMEEGKVKYNVMCPTCNTVLLEPVDGSIKGERVNGNRWLVEADVVLASPTLDHIRDTLAFKQFFTKE